MSCPANSGGVSVPDGCLRDAGYTGSVSATTITPFYTSSRSLMACPASSAGTSVSTGCFCNANYSGSVTKSSNSPFYTGACSAVVCPANSKGTSLPSRCSCSASYSATLGLWWPSWPVHSTPVRAWQCLVQPMLAAAPFQVDALGSLAIQDQ